MPATLHDVKFKFTLAKMAFDRMKQAEAKMQSEFDRENMDPIEFRKRHEEPGEFAYHLGAFLTFARSTMYYIRGIVGPKSEVWNRTKNSEIFKAVTSLRDHDVHADVVPFDYRQYTGPPPISMSAPVYVADVKQVPTNSPRPISSEARDVLRGGITGFIPPFLDGIEIIISQHLKE